MAKRPSPLGFLSLLGLLGLLGLPTGNPGFFGFFGFFGFAGLFGTIKQDERFSLNIARSGLNGFVVALVGLAFLIVAVALWPRLETAALGVAATFVLTLLTFVASFRYYDR